MHDEFAVGFGILISSQMIRDSCGQLNLNRGEVSHIALAMIQAALSKILFLQ